MNKITDSTLFKNNVTQINNILNLIEPDVSTTYTDVLSIAPLNKDDIISKYTVTDKTGKASLVARNGEVPSMKINGTEVKYPLNKIGTKYELDKQDIRLSKKDGGISLDSNSALLGRRLVEEEINSVVYLGDENFQYLGLLRDTGVTTKTVSANLSATNVYTIIKEAIDSIPKKFRKSQYSFVLADKEYNKLTSRNANTDRTWITMLREVYPNVTYINENDIEAGAKYWDVTLKTIATGTGILIPKSRELVWAKIGNIRNIPSKLDMMEDEEIKPTIRYDIINYMTMVEAAFSTAIVLVKGM